MSEYNNLRRLVTQAREAGSPEFPMSLDRALYDPERVSALWVKAEEYIRRIQTSIHPEVVRPAICKLAILDELLNSDEGWVDYETASKHAAFGIAQYGQDLLIPKGEDPSMVNKEFDAAYDAIEAYLTQGNNGVQGGTGIIELGDL